MNSIISTRQNDRFQATSAQLPARSAFGEDRVTLTDSSSSHKTSFGKGLFMAALILGGGGAMIATSGCSGPPPQDTPQVNVAPAPSNQAPADTTPQTPLTPEQAQQRALDLKQRELDLQERQLNLQEQQAKQTQELQQMQKTQLQIQQAKEGYAAGQAIGGAMSDAINNILH